MTSQGSYDLRILLITARVIAVMGASVVAVLSATHEFNKDEIEHVHSAWLIASGSRPFSDFFQHHHRLMWDVFALVLPWTGQTASTMVMFRVVMLAQLAAVVFVTYRLARNASDGQLVPWLALALLTSMSAFGRHAYLIRPDLPELLCIVIGVLLLSRSSGPNATRRALGSGFFFGLGFLFSMKAVVVLAIEGLIILIWWLRRRVTAPFVVAFVVACLAPIAVYFAYMSATGTFRDYYLANWVLNMRITAQTLDTRLTPGDTLFFNLTFWLLGVGSAVWLIVRRGGMQKLELMTLNGIGIIVLLIILGRTESRSALVAMPFLAVTAAAGFEDLSRWARRPRVAAALLVAICAAGLFDLVRGVPATHREQRHMIDFVLAHVSPDEAVYDGNNKFNLFRRDLHYFWFHPTLGRGGPGSVELASKTRGAAAATMGRTSYEACALVRSGNPRVLSDTTIDLDACDLAKDYALTGYAGIWLSRD